MPMTLETGTANREERERSPEGLPLYLAATALALAVSLGAGILGRRAGLEGQALTAAILALAALLLPFFALGMTDLPGRLRAAFEARRSSVLAALLALLLPYVFLAAATEALDLRPFLKIALYVLVPAALLGLADRSSPQPGVFEALAAVALWIPLDYRLVQDAWPLPAGAGGHALHTILAVDLAVILFVAYRGIEQVGWRFRLGPGGLRAVLSNFVVFAAIGIPIGLATGFLAWNPRITSPAALGARFLTILFVTGLPEELLFRGIVQNGLRQSLGSPRAALVLASVLFGLAHLNNGPSPDWRYALLAALAGIFYGRAYERTRGLMAPAAVHALVDTVWGALLHV